MAVLNSGIYPATYQPYVQYVQQYQQPQFQSTAMVPASRNNTFSYCYGAAEYHIKPTSVPTGGTTMFSNIVSDCVIYVPSAKLDDYKAAENWSAYASYMQGE